MKRGSPGPATMGAGAGGGTGAETGAAFCAVVDSGVSLGAEHATSAAASTPLTSSDRNAHSTILAAGGAEPVQRTGGPDRAPPLRYTRTSMFATRVLDGRWQS